jgi:hypothetical protein
MEFIPFFWDAAVELDSNAAKMDEGIRPLCRPEVRERLFASAGLKGVEVVPIDIPTQFRSFDDYWQPFLGGQGPAPPMNATSAISTEEAHAGCPTDRKSLLALRGVGGESEATVFLMLSIARSRLILPIAGDH